MVKKFISKVQQKYAGVRQIERRPIKTKKTINKLNQTKSHVPKEIYQDNWKSFVGKLWW